MGDKYAPNDKVFAKIKGFAPWPARVMERVPGRDEKYRIFFYGTHDESVVKLDQLYKYNKDTKAKYGKPSKKAKFQDAMTEIEEEIVAEGGEQNAEPLDALEEPVEEKPKVGEGESEGELMIDEGAPALPPVLKKEVETPEPAGKAKRPRTLSKRESTSTPQQSTPTPATQASMAVTPGTPDFNQLPGSEIVSPSGRKIKPKRFAPVGKGKTEPDSQLMTKRSKRGSISAKSAPLVKGDEAPHLEVEGRDNNEAAPRSRTSSRSKAETMDNKGPPTLKAVSKRASSANNKQIPVLEPSQPAPSTRKSERLTRSSSKDESKDSILTDDPTPELEPQEMPMDIDERELDKENSNELSLVYGEDEDTELALTKEQIQQITYEAGAQFDSYVDVQPGAEVRQMSGLKMIWGHAISRSSYIKRKITRKLCYLRYKASGKNKENGRRWLKDPNNRQRHLQKQAEVRASAIQDGRHVCPTCRKPFCSQWDLTRHLNTHSVDPSKARHNQKRAEVRASAIQEGRHVCPTCRKPFCSQWDLTRHLNTHSPNKAALGPQASKLPNSDITVELSQKFQPMTPEDLVKPSYLEWRKELISTTTTFNWNLNNYPSGYSCYVAIGVDTHGEIVPPSKLVKFLNDNRAGDSGFKIYVGSAWGKQIVCEKYRKAGGFKELKAGGLTMYAVHRRHFQSGLQANDEANALKMEVPIMWIEYIRHNKIQRLQTGNEIKANIRFERSCLKLFPVSQNQDGTESSLALQLLTDIAVQPQRFPILKLCKGKVSPSYQPCGACLCTLGYPFCVVNIPVYSEDVVMVDT